MISRILLATDGSAFSELAGEYAIFLARKLGAELTALHVLKLEPPRRLTPEEVEEEKARAAVHIFRQLERLAGEAGVRLRKEVLISRDVAEAIIEEVRFGRYELLVVGSLGKTGLRRLLLGSVSERLVRHAPCPVLVVR
ncbi:MAG: universal stress protein [Euryarchaeota archaeon]|nr:universal stress protein [Euryarchaeota archaeon]